MSVDALTILVLIGISIVALFAAYFTFKIFKLIYCIGYNIFLFFDEKFSIVAKLQHIKDKTNPQKTNEDSDFFVFPKAFYELLDSLSETFLINGIYKSYYNYGVLEFVGNLHMTKNEENNSQKQDYSDIPDDDFIEKAVEFAVYNGQVSVSMLQHKLKLGYAKTARIMDKLEEMGIK